MIASASLSRATPVPYRDSVAPVRAIARLEMDPGAPRPPPHRDPETKARLEARARHSAASAAAGFAAHVMLEAGGAGQDACAPARAGKAYGQAAVHIAPRLRLVA